MSVSALSERAPAPVSLLNPRRILFTLGISILLGLLLGTVWQSGLLSALERTVAIGLTAMIVFGLFESWPRRLPQPVARWVWQVVGVALSVPITTFVIYVVSTEAGAPPFWQVSLRLTGFVMLSVLGVLIGPWVALAALVRQKDALARHQRLAFELQRSELERQAVDARLRLLQGQVAPHFLFNTLANVQALVETGSAQAPVVLDHLIAYLRAA
ncbi:MAG TPA: histidine kinase, partial [Gemmatimonadales bacterium]|nr:histidine kinase [Gemmatimonadales bacterium]